MQPLCLSTKRHFRDDDSWRGFGTALWLLISVGTAFAQPQWLPESLAIRPDAAIALPAPLLVASATPFADIQSPIWMQFRHLSSLPTPHALDQNGSGWAISAAAARQRVSLPEPSTAWLPEFSGVESVRPVFAQAVKRFIQAGLSFVPGLAGSWQFAAISLPVNGAFQAWRDIPSAKVGLSDPVLEPITTPVRQYLLPVSATLSKSAVDRETSVQAPDLAALTLDLSQPELPADQPEMIGGHGSIRMARKR